jgi:hypothetical protein
MKILPDDNASEAEISLMRVFLPATEIIIPCFIKEQSIPL